MSFRQFGGLNYAPKNNIISSNYNASHNLYVSKNVGEPNSYINYLSEINCENLVFNDISGNNISCEVLICNTDVSLNNISCNDISCNDISCEVLICNSDVSLNNISCNDISCNDISCNIITSSSFNSLSDYRIKCHISSLKNTNLIDNLKLITYFNVKTEKFETGVLAHELQKYFPHLVTGEKDGKELQTVNYMGFIPILIKEIQILKEKVNKLTNLIDEITK
jgi:hypothetical protein